MKYTIWTSEEGEEGTWWIFSNLNDYMLLFISWKSRTCLNLCWLKNKAETNEHVVLRFAFVVKEACGGRWGRKVGKNKSVAAYLHAKNQHGLQLVDVFHLRWWWGCWVLWETLIRNTCYVEVPSVRWLKLLEYYLAAKNLVFLWHIKKHLYSYQKCPWMVVKLLELEKGEKIMKCQYNILKPLKHVCTFLASNVPVSMFQGLGTDEDTLIEIICSRTNQELNEINRVYRESKFILEVLMLYVCTWSCLAKFPLVLVWLRFLHHICSVSFMLGHKKFCTGILDISVFM